MWRDETRSVFHSLFHRYPFPSGPHAWSLDGRAWRSTPNDADGSRDGRAYQRRATFTDAPPRDGGCRERPSLIFGTDGAPIALVNGFDPDPSKVGSTPSGSCRFATIDYSYTLVQPLRRKRRKGAAE